MPDPFRLSPQDYAALAQQLSALEDSARLLTAVSRWLAPGMRVSVLAAYHEMWHKTDAALRAQVLHSQRALALWEAQRMEQILRHAGTKAPQEEDSPHAHP